MDFLTPTARTANGFGVGSKADAIRAAFGAAVSETPSTYEPEITDLNVAQGAAKFVFEIDDNVVRSWRAKEAGWVTVSAATMEGAGEAALKLAADINTRAAPWAFGLNELDWGAYSTPLNAIAE